MCDLNVVQGGRMRIVQPLSCKQVEGLPVGVHNVGGVVGLCLRKQLTTQRYFLRYYIGKRVQFLNLPKGISLKESRRLGLEIRQKLEQGINPKDELVQKRLGMIEQVERDCLTFNQVCDKWIGYRSDIGYWKGKEKTLVVLKGRLNKFIYPFIGNKKIVDIDVEDIVRVLSSLNKSQSVYSKVKTILNNVFKWSVVKKYRQDNPVDLSASMLKDLNLKFDPVRNQPSLDFNEVPMFVKTLIEKDSQSCLMLCFSILTCSRSQSVRMLKWGEIDFENKVWNIPESHDKVKGNDRIRTIMLSDESLEVLESSKRFCKGLIGDDDLVFPNKQRTSYCDTQFMSVIRRLHKEKLEHDGIGWVDQKTNLLITQHGFRSSFKTWSVDDRLGNNLKYDRQTSEYCLLHSKKDPYNNAYDRSEMEHSRRRLMSDWGTWCWSMIRTP